MKKTIKICRFCRAVHVYPEDCNPDIYCEICNARGFKRKLWDFDDYWKSYYFNAKEKKLEKLRYDYANSLRVKKKKKENS